MGRHTALVGSLLLQMKYSPLDGAWGAGSGPSAWLASPGAPPSPPPAGPRGCSPSRKEPACSFWTFRFKSPCTH